MRAPLLKLWLEDEGQDLTEYALLLCLLCMVAVTAMRGFASSISSIYSQASCHVISAPENGIDASRSLSDSFSTRIKSRSKKFESDILSKTLGIHSAKR